MYSTGGVTVYDAGDRENARGDSAPSREAVTRFGARRRRAARTSALTITSATTPPPTETPMMSARCWSLLPLLPHDPEQVNDCGSAGSDWAQQREREGEKNKNKTNKEEKKR